MINWILKRPLTAAAFSGALCSLLTSAALMFFATPATITLHDSAILRHTIIDRASLKINGGNAEITDNMFTNEK